MGVVAVTVGTYNASLGDQIQGNCSGGTITVVLPTPISGGAPITIQKTDTSSNPIRVQGIAFLTAFQSPNQTIVLSPSNLGWVVGYVDAATEEAVEGILGQPGGFASLDAKGHVPPMQQGGHGSYLGVFFNQPLGATATYTGNPYEAVSVYRSGDGYDWSDHVNNPVLFATPGLRDFSLIRQSDKWFLAATNASNASPFTSTFPIYSSTDLVNWSLVATLNMSAETGGTQPEAWGPYLYQDPMSGNIYCFFMVSGGADTASAIWWMRATDTVGLTTWTAPQQVTINNLPSGTLLVSDTAIMYNAGSNPGPYHVFFTDDTHTYILHATASSPVGPWTVIQSGNWLGLGTQYEAPIIIQVGAAKWRLYADNWSNKGYGWMETTDPTLQTWGAWTQLTWNGVVANGHFRHGMVIPLNTVDLAGAVLGAAQPTNISGTLLNSVQYGPLTAATYTTTSATVAALDTTNLTVKFTAPPSGNVIVVLSAQYKIVTSGASGVWAVATHGTLTTMSSPVIINIAPAANWFDFKTIRQKITGLTPGTQYQWDWVFSGTAADTFQTFAGEAAGIAPATMEVWAA